MRRRSRRGAEICPLPFDSTRGYLPGLLKALHIPVESQMAVFSKTSIQSLRIEPLLIQECFISTTRLSRRLGPRRLTEIARRRTLSEASSLYTLQQRPDEHVVHREDCLNCHKSGTTLMRSVVPTPDGIPSAESEKLWGRMVCNWSIASLGFTSAIRCSRV